MKALLLCIVLFSFNAKAQIDFSAVPINENKEVNSIDKVKSSPEWIIYSNMLYIWNTTKKSGQAEERYKYFGSKLMVSKKIRDNLYGGIGIAYILDRVEAKPQYIVSNGSSIGFPVQDYYYGADYLHEMRTISPILNLEYLMPVTHKLIFLVNLYGRLNFEKIYFDDQTKYFFSNTDYSYTTSRLAMQTGFSPALRWNFSKYVGIQVNLGHLEYYTKVGNVYYKHNSNFERQKDKSFNLETNPLNWRIGAYLYF